MAILKYNHNSVMLEKLFIDLSARFVKCDVNKISTKFSLDSILEATRIWRGYLFVIMTFAIIMHFIFTFEMDSSLRIFIAALFCIVYALFAYSVISFYHELEKSTNTSEMPDYEADEGIFKISGW